MDEVGRGTSVQDGLAIAFSTIHHLITVNKSRTLFATHFHELADLLGCSDGQGGDGVFDAVKFFHTDVDKTEVRTRSVLRYVFAHTSTGRVLRVLSPTQTRSEPGQPWTEGRPARRHARVRYQCCSSSFRLLPRHQTRDLAQGSGQAT